MTPSVIDGDDWIAKRLAFLRERLAGDLSDDERRAVEAEVGTLSRERGIGRAGFPFLSVWRRLLRRNR